MSPYMHTIHLDQSHPSITAPHHPFLEQFQQVSLLCFHTCLQNALSIFTTPCTLSIFPSPMSSCFQPVGLTCYDLCLFLWKF
jgi:hypothetical protein